MTTAETDMTTETDLDLDYHCTRIDAERDRAGRLHLVAYGRANGTCGAGGCAGSELRLGRIENVEFDGEREWAEVEGDTVELQSGTRERLERMTADWHAQSARVAASGHLSAIGWRPSQGLSDEALGLGDAWGSKPDGIEQGDWSALCAEAVRAEAKRRTNEQ